MEDSKKPLVFTNEIPTDPIPPPHNATTTIQNFTATGRPFNPSSAQTGSGLNSHNTAESMGGGMLDILPRRYNDDSLITIPVLPSERVAIPKSPTSPLIPLSPTTPTSPTSFTSSSPSLTPTPTPTTPTQISLSYHPTTTLVYADLYSGSPDPIIHEKPSNALKFWHRRKSSTSNSTPSTPKPKPPPLFRTRRSTSSSGNGNSKGPEFIMKQVTRGDYLKFYAKDEQGRYIGSEDPAGDCILRDERDVRRWRSGGAWRNEL